MGGCNKFTDYLACGFALTCLIPLIFGPLFGLSSIGDCPYQPAIPYFLVAIGGIPALLIAIVIIVFRRGKDATDDDETPSCKMTTGIFLALMGINQIFGLYLVWNIRNSVSYDITTTEYCKKEVYYFAVAVAFYPILLIVIAASLVWPEMEPLEWFNDCVECIWT